MTIRLYLMYLRKKSNMTPHFQYISCSSCPSMFVLSSCPSMFIYQVETHVSPIKTQHDTPFPIYILFILSIDVCFIILSIDVHLL